jgi:hypothetical protein
VASLPPKSGDRRHAVAGISHLGALLLISSIFQCYPIILKYPSYGERIFQESKFKAYA